MDDATFATMGLRLAIPVGVFECPQVPVLVDCSEEIKNLKTGELVTMTRALWSRMNKPFLVLPSEWGGLMSTSLDQMRRHRAEHR